MFASAVQYLGFIGPARRQEKSLSALKSGTIGAPGPKSFSLSNLPADVRCTVQPPAREFKYKHGWPTFDVLISRYVSVLILWNASDKNLLTVLHRIAWTFVHLRSTALLLLAIQVRSSKQLNSTAEFLSDLTTPASRPRTWYFPNRERPAKRCPSLNTKCAVTPQSIVAIACDFGVSLMQAGCTIVDVFRPLSPGIDTGTLHFFDPHFAAMSSFTGEPPSPLSYS
ncbi:hypothetical protein C8F04DRAFT_706149 [Mycena alexandri]|uniref:Uncharacterized protein n=1 Tax=Mycena alexandri TaxID=1745969 RepID=A0AAD6SP15_9AGAR|nr:hypothetical protein C8F04DRAFT_706149 [Mycena alexandri]